MTRRTFALACAALILVCATPPVRTANVSLAKAVLNPNVLQHYKPKKQPLKSGFIPQICQILANDAFLVDCWLQHFPEIAGTIRWEVPGRLASTTVAWPQWDESRKQDLRNAFAAATSWYNGGMVHYTGTAVDEVPANQEEPWIDITHKTVLDEHTQAWPLYVAHIAFSLAAEIHAWVPWSLRNYDQEALNDLFDSSPNMFTYTRGQNDYYYSIYPGYIVTHTSTPTHPIVTLKFLKANRLIGASPQQTIGLVLDWARNNLAHFFGPGTIDNWNQYWQYKGAPPVARVLSGTTTTDPTVGSMWATAHWTAGCYGTSDFLAWVLRVVNVPATRRSSASTCAHVMPYFSGEKLYLSHGDDPYNALAKVGYPAGLLLINQSAWDAWFETGDFQTSCNNVGRRTVELAVWYLADYVVGKYCADTTNNKTHAEGEVYQVYSNAYSVEQLEATDLWGRLAAKVPTSTAYQCIPLQGGQ